MNVLNVHERRLDAPPDTVGALLRTLGMRGDRLWPVRRWPRMAFDRPLEVGALGGHGPIRYVVEAWIPDVKVQFRFVRPAGFHGSHWYEVVPESETACVLRHTLAMRVRGRARVSWPLVYRPLHDALIEDSLDQAAASIGLPTRRTRWNWRVRLLRRILRERRAPASDLRLD